MSDAKRVVATAIGQVEVLPLEIDIRPLGPQEIAGRTLVSLISTGTELGTYSGAWEFPQGLGYSAVIELTEIGSDVRSLKAGDRVYASRGHQSYHRMHHDDAILLPDGLPPETAVFGRMMGVSMSTLVTTTARPPGSVLVTGLGLVGNMACQVFKNCGYSVTGVDPDESRRDLATRSNINPVLSEVPVDDPNYSENIELVVECSGHERAVLDGCRTVKKRGEVVTVGAPWSKRDDIQLHDLHHAIFHRYVTLRSGWEWEVPGKPTEFKTGSIKANLTAALNWLAEGKVVTEDLGNMVSPSNAQEVYQSLLHRRTGTLTSLFDWTA